MVKKWIDQEKFVYQDDFISDEVRQWAMVSLKNVPWEAGVITHYSDHSHALSDERICSQLKEHSFPSEIRFLVNECRQRVCDMLEVPRSHCENALVVRYGVGGKFDPHLDTGLYPENDRQYTFLLTLHQPLKGGETSFVRLKKQVESVNRRGLIWTNFGEDGLPSNRMLHAGNPVIEGEKYILVFWIRKQPY